MQRRTTSVFFTEKDAKRRLRALFPSQIKNGLTGDQRKENEKDPVRLPRQDFGTTRNSQNYGAKRGNLGHLLCHETTRRLLFSRIKVGNGVVIVNRVYRETTTFEK